MKVAVTTFKNSVSPRVDISDSLSIYNIEKGSVTGQEKCPLSYDQPSELVSFLQEKDIKKVICGGCPQFYLRALNFYRFDVVHGVSGEPDQIIAQLIDGQLDSRFGRAGYFLIVDTDSETVLTNEENKYKNEGHGVGIKTATYVVSSGCKVAIGAQPGPKAAAILEQGNVKLIVAETGTVKEMLQRIEDKI